MNDYTSRLRNALVDRYRLEREVGRGGMASVYLAHDVRHDRKVAVKVLKEDLSRQLGAERFLHEVRIAAGLSHPHILPVFDSGESDGFLYYVMPYMEGDTLRARLAREGQLAVKDAVRALRDVADALAYAHEHHVVHRDVKPDNVMLSGRHAMVADFGIARAVSQVTGGQHVTTAGVALGTPTYMSPEQAAADPNIDHLTDVYAFGVMAYELLSGHPPFSGTAQQVMAAHVTKAPAPLTERRADVPVLLADAIMQCLAKSPGDRWQNLDDVVRVLESVATPSGGVPRTGAQPAAARVDQYSIAVLPFRNVTADAETEYFADGITEEITNLLSQTAALKVAARTSSFSFKDKNLDVCAIGDRLRVASVLEGSIRQVGRRIRVTTQLVNVRDGYQLWSGKYDRDLEDVFAVQDEIATAITQALTAKLVAPVAPAVAEIRRPVDVTTYSLYLKARYHWNKRTIPAMKVAVGLFQEALARDPDYAPAHAGIADCYGLLGWVAFGAIPPHEAFPRAEESAHRALALDDTLAEAHNTLGWTRIVYGWDVPESERRFRRALELNPSFATAHSWLAMHLVWTGRFEEALAEAEAAMALDPFSPIIHTLAGWVLYFVGRIDDSIDLARKALELDAGYLRARLGLGLGHEERGQLDEAIAEFTTGVELSGGSARFVAALGHAQALAGQPDRARQQLARLEQLSKSEYVSPAYAADIYAALGEADNAMERLERAYDARSGALVYVHVDPHFASLRTDPRFVSLCARVGMSQSSQ